jgi:signal transduction histidine kinase
MPNVLKQFGEKATGLPSGNQFHQARLRLTLVYALLLLAILFISSGITYSLFSSRLERRFRGHHFPPPPPEFIESGFPDQARAELVTSLLIVNGVLFIAGVGVSYWLAGITLRPIQQTYDRQRQFLSDASHELRTPLAILQTDLENELADKKTSVPTKDNARSHLEEVGRMSHLVKDLLLISRLDAYEKTSVPLENVDLTEIGATAVERMKRYATKQNIKLALSPPPKSPLTIRANREHILQALTNLIKNGIDYNKKGGGVTVTVAPAETMATVNITDTGIGIPQAEIPKLFDRFYRTDKSRSRQVGGNGLGLAIVQSIAHTYGGAVTIVSTVAQGTTVTLSLPRQ